MTFTIGVGKRVLLGAAVLLALWLALAAGGDDEQQQKRALTTTAADIHVVENARPADTPSHGTSAPSTADGALSSSSSLTAPCATRPKTFEDLGTFPFWGKRMNSSWPCPASGMNNQLTLLLAFWHCFETKQRRPRLQATLAATPGFRWKDISCSPTGGKDGARRYAVGSADYTYSWFRWSEVYHILDAPRHREESTAPVASTLCLHDSYSWNEHPPLRRCASNIGHLYGSRTWWDLRGRLEPHARYAEFIRCFFAAATNAATARPTDDGTSMKAAMAQCLAAPSKEEADRTTRAVQQPRGLARRVLGVHMRRGDYAHFCDGLHGSSGIRKFRVPPFRWLRGAAASLSNKFPDTCAPSDATVFGHIRGLLSNRSSSPSSAAIAVLFVASNSAAFVTAVRAAIASSHPDVLVASLADALALVENGDQQWPERFRDNANRNGRSAVMSLTDKSMLDIIALAMSDVVVLNRYSTFSQSVIDERVLRAASRAPPQSGKADFSTLPGVEGIMWW